MRKSIRITGVILAALLLFSMCGVFAAETAASPLVQEQGLLTALGLYDEKVDTEDLNREITREEFAYILAGFYNARSGAAANTQKPYQDVDASRWSASSIYYLTDLALIIGYPDGTYRPTDTVTVEQATKSLVILAGYGAEAESLGGYPNGYLRIANQLGILPGASGYQDVLSYGKCTEMLYDLLDAEMLLNTGAYEKYYMYEVDRDITVLNYFFNVYTMRGQFRANGKTVLYGETPQKDGYVKVGDYTFRAARNFDDTFGMQVTLYYRQESEDVIGDALYMYANEYDNDLIVVDAKDISDATTAKTFCYYDENGRERKESIPESVNVIFNGRLKLLYSTEDLMPSIGQVKLIDGDRSGDHETIVVDSYLDYWTMSVSNSNNQFRANDKLGKRSLDIDLANDDAAFFLNGAEATADSAKSGAVLSVAADLVDEEGAMTEATCYKILVSTATVSGTIEQRSDDEVVIDGETYALSAAVASQTALQAGTSGVFHLNAFGQIVGVTDETGEQYAFLISAQQGKGVDDRVQLKMFIQNGRHVIYECATNLRIDGESYAGRADEILDTLRASSTEYREKTGFAPEGSVGVEQLVKYRENSEGKLSSIDTVYANAGFARPEDDGLCFSDLIQGSRSTPAYYLKNGGTIFGKVVVGATMPIFTVPSDLKNEEGYNVSTMDQQVAAGTSNVAASFYSNLAVFDSDEFARAGAILTVGTVSSSVNVKEIERMMLVERFVTTVDDDGEMMTGISGYKITTCSPMTLLLKTSELITLTKIEPGDVIRWADDDKGLATVLEKTCSPLGDADDGTFIGQSGSSKYASAFYSDFRATLGNVVSVEDGAIRIHYKDTSKFGACDEVNHTNALGSVLIYDSASGKITRGSVADLKTEQDYGEGNGSLIFTYQNFGQLKTIVVFQ